MIKIENEEIVGWKHAIRGMRNPKNSWDKADSRFDTIAAKDVITESYDIKNMYEIGENDLKLMATLAGAGSDHGKFMRMIVVYCDITAPLYWWKEFDTYKVGTVANSCSTMHKIHAKEFTLDDFSCEHLDDEDMEVMEHLIDVLNENRAAFNWCSVSEKKDYWWQMIQLLPSSYNQRRTVMVNYQVLKNMYHARRNHKLDEWHTFCEWIETLPHSELITGGFEE